MHPLKLAAINSARLKSIPLSKRWLDENGISYEERHIKEQNPSAEELRDWHRQSGLPLKRFFNTSGLLYKVARLSPESAADQCELFRTGQPFDRRFPPERLRALCARLAVNHLCGQA